MKKIILVANVSKEHVLKFHVPTIKRLVEDGWQVDVACGGNDKVPYCHKQYELPIDRSPFKSHFIKAIRQLRDIISQEQYDVVYCHTSVGGIVARIAANPFRRKGTRVVKFAHGTYFYKGAPWYNFALYYPLYKYLSYKTDSIITITQEDYEFTTRHFSSSKVYFLNGIGVNTSKYKVTDKESIREQYRSELSIPQDAIVMIYVAELIKNKNQSLLLKVLQRVLASHSNTYLVLAGPDHADGKYQMMADQLGVSDHVRFLGWRDDIPNIYAASDICTPSSIREGLGLNLIEAMAAGLPIVATGNSGHSDILNRDPECGYLSSFDDKVFAEDVIRLISDKDLRKEMGAKGIEASLKYDNSTIVGRILEIVSDEHVVD